MNLKEIKEIIALMNENNLGEIEIEREGLKLKLKKTALEAALQTPIHYAVESLPTPPRVNVAAAPSAAEQAKTDAAQKTTKDIKSPMVGTFYRAPSPEAATFVEVGQMVEIGQVVCIVEAMKLMNEIKSEIRGKVVEVAVSNSEPVEFGQTLFVVEPL
jgi:acetyl-CoA carboxylase biotin carboxyl carrier protein